MITINSYYLYTLLYLFHSPFLFYALEERKRNEICEVNVPSHLLSYYFRILLRIRFFLPFYFCFTSTLTHILEEFHFLKIMCKYSYINAYVRNEVSTFSFDIIKFGYIGWLYVCTCDCICMYVLLLINNYNGSVSITSVIHM